MQTHEATMHRVDAELAAGWASAPIDPAVAADGVAHAFEVMWAWWGTLPGFEFVTSSGPVDLLASDTGDRWVVQPGRWRGAGQSGKSHDVPGARLAGGESAASVEGTAEQLVRWLWGRGPRPAASGPAGDLDALDEAVAQGMQ